MNREQREIKPLLNQPTDFEKEQLKAEIRRVNQVLRETHNPREFKQNKKYLERLERKLRNYGQWIITLWQNTSY